MSTPTTDKDSLVNSVAILLSIPSQQAGLNKLTIPTLELIYGGLLRNANSWQLVQEEAKTAKNEAFIAKGRIRVLEAEVRRLEAKLKGKNNG